METADAAMKLTIKFIRYTIVLALTHVRKHEDSIFQLFSSKKLKFRKLSVLPKIM